MAIRGHSLLLVVIQGDSWPLAFNLLVVIYGYSWLFVATRDHSWSLVVPFVYLQRR